MLIDNKADWLTTIKSPISEANPAGEDPRYSDEFFLVKQEIEKLSDLNYALILENSAKVLELQARDLRVCGYLLLALCHEKSVDGLLLGLETYNAVLEHFWDDLSPRKDEARLAALKWLSNPRLMALITALVPSFEQVDTINQLLEKFHGLVDSKFPGAHFRLSFVTKWLKNFAKPEEAAPAASPSPLQKVGQLFSRRATVDDIEIKSNNDFSRTTSKLLAYLAEQNQSVQAAAYMRAYRWGAMLMPSHDNNKTAINSPNEHAINRMDTALEQSDAEKILAVCDSLFMSSGGVLWLDLQLYAYRAAEQLEKTALATYIAQEFSGLLKRLPELINFTFNNDMPFANSETKAWAEELLQQGSASKATTDSEQMFDVNALVKQVKKQTGKHSIGPLLATCAELKTRNQKEAFYKQWTMARLCQQSKRHDLALPLFDQLLKQVEHHQLADWQPHIALEVWKDCHESLKAQIKKVPEAQKTALQLQANELYRLICQVDITAAVGM